MTREAFDKATIIVKEQESVSNSIAVIAQYLSRNIGDKDCSIAIRGVGEYRIDAETAISVLKEERRKLCTRLQDLNDELEKL